MIKLYSKPLEKSIELHRIIGHIKGSDPGPTVIFLGGIHGNEPAGVFALHTVIQELKEKGTTIRGSIYAIAGNLWALQRGIRYEQEDLNRLWSLQAVKKLQNGVSGTESKDKHEQIALYQTLKEILELETGPYYFFDLHTTSSKTIPFITVNDNLLNRKFTSQYPLPIVLGIEEYLQGPLLSYVNELGYVAFGFEGGQHDDLDAVKNHIAFTYISLIFSHSLSKNEIDFDHYFNFLKKSIHLNTGFYEIFNHFGLDENDTFKMNPGYINFQKIKKNEVLAIHNDKTVKSAKNGKIFMPLYQNKGTDGFFIIKGIPRFFLKLSALLRIINLDSFLTWLPGIHWYSEKRDTLMVNLKLAPFLTKDFFHLLGYRSKTIDKDHLIMKNREVASRKQDYEDTTWFKK